MPRAFDLGWNVKGTAINLPYGWPPVLLPGNPWKWISDYDFGVFQQGILNPGDFQ